MLGPSFGRRDFLGSGDHLNLECVWEAIASNDLDVTKALLVKGKRGTISDPDLAFAMWCIALGHEAHSNLRKMLLDAGTNDEQRTRLFSQITRNRGFQDDGELREIPALALKLFKTGDSPLAWAAVKSLRPEIDKIFQTQEERLGHARLLLNELQGGASETGALEPVTQGRCRCALRLALAALEGIGRYDVHSQPVPSSP